MEYIFSAKPKRQLFSEKIKRRRLVFPVLKSTLQPKEPNRKKDKSSAHQKQFKVAKGLLHKLKRSISLNGVQKVEKVKTPPLYPPNLAAGSFMTVNRSTPRVQRRGNLKDLNFKITKVSNQIISHSKPSSVAKSIKVGGSQSSNKFRIRSNQKEAQENAKKAEILIRGFEYNSKIFPPLPLPKSPEDKIFRAFQTTSRTRGSKLSVFANTHTELQARYKEKINARMKRKSSEGGVVLFVASENNSISKQEMSIESMLSLTSSNIDESSFDINEFVLEPLNSNPQSDLDQESCSNSISEENETSSKDKFSIVLFNKQGSILELLRGNIIGRGIIQC